MIASRTGVLSLAAVGIGIALGAALQLALRPPALHAVSLETSPRTFEIHHAPIIRASHRDCTRPVGLIGLAGTSLSPQFPDHLLGVAASATGCTLAVWSSEGVYISRDDGAAWTRAVTTATLANEVAIDAAENVYIVTHDLAVGHPDGTTASHRLPFDHVQRVATSGAWVIVASARELAISRDEGATWERHATPEQLTSAAWFVDGAGAIRVAVGGETPDDPITLWNLTAAGWRLLWTSPAHVPVIDRSYPDGKDGQTASINQYAFAHDGTLAAEVWDRREHRIFLVDAAGAVKTADKIPASLAFTAITGTKGDWATRDAHGTLIVLLNQRGPIRLDDHADTMLLGYSDAAQRWLVGDLRVN